MNSRETKEMGQVFTPNKIVNIILDSIGYSGEKILKQTIMEPSLGEGIFITEIIQRIISAARAIRMEDKSIIKIITENVYGIEKDASIYKKAMSNIKNLVKENGLLIEDFPNIICEDTIDIYCSKKFAMYKNKFDFVVGNPPYVRIHNMDKHSRSKLDRFELSDGIVDLYVMFYEIGIKMLGDGGKLGFITPNSFLKNKSQKCFRDYLIEQKLIRGIYDFKASKIFEGYGVYAGICLLENNKTDDNINIEYREYDKYKIIKKNSFKYRDFKNRFVGNQWLLLSKKDQNFIEKNQKKQRRMSEIVDVQNGIVTNRDYVYVGSLWNDETCVIPSDNKKDFAFFKPIKSEADDIAFKIECSIMKKCVKASKYDGKENNLYIIFPYKLINDEYKIMDESYLKNNYSLAYNYLSGNRSSLAKRDMDKALPWYAYGRSQGFTNLNKPKIVFKTIVSKEQDSIETFLLDKDTIVYSGLYTTLNIKADPAKEKQILNFACDVFKSEDFVKYCKLIGKDMSGGYVSISSKQIQSFRFDS